MPKKNSIWQKQAHAAKATQVAFDVSELVHKYIQRNAVEHALKPSDYIRKVLGLSYKSKKVRPRFSISLTSEDYEQLATIFHIDANDHIAIKHAVTLRLLELAENNE